MKHKQLNGMTQKELASILGVHDSLIRHWLSGRRVPNQEQKEALEAMGISFPAKKISQPTVQPVQEVKLGLSGFDKLVLSKVGPEPKKEDFPNPDDYHKAKWGWSRAKKNLLSRSD